MRYDSCECFICMGNVRLGLYDSRARPEQRPPAFKVTNYLPDPISPRVPRVISAHVTDLLLYPSLQEPAYAFPKLKLERCLLRNATCGLVFLWYARTQPSSWEGKCMAAKTYENKERILVVMLSIRWDGVIAIYQRCTSLWLQIAVPSYY